MAPGSDSVAAARLFAGMFSCSTGFGSFLACLGCSSFGGFSTGTVILSLPGSSAWRGGSFIWLPPPPPPPPGPGWLSQTMLAVRLIGQVRRRATCRLEPNAEQQHEAHHGEVIGERRHERRAHALLLLLEQERDLDRVRTLDVHRQMPGGSDWH